MIPKMQASANNSRQQRREQGSRYPRRHRPGVAALCVRCKTMIRDSLIPALKSEFTGWEIAFGVPPQAIATFPAAQQAVGRVLVYDDGAEATVLIEKFTHGHFNPYDETLREDQRDKMATEHVVDFLKPLFSDRVLLHTSADNRVGGWTRLDLEGGPVGLSPSFRYFLWSRPYEP